MAEEAIAQEVKMMELLEVVGEFKPNETVFEVEKRGDSSNTTLMVGRRKALGTRERAAYA